jgi:hypothetical protein
LDLIYWLWALLSAALYVGFLIGSVLIFLWQLSSHILALALTVLMVVIPLPSNCHMSKNLSSNLHAGNIREAVGEIPSYHERD